MTDQYSPPSVVLFDLDETLFDHRNSSREALAWLRRTFPQIDHIPLDTLETEAFRILNETHERVLAGELTQDEGRLARFRRLFEWCEASVDPEALVEAIPRYRAAYRASRRPMEGATALLSALADRVRIGIVTNNFIREQEGKLADCGLTECIDFMVTSEEAGCAKPDHAIFDLALERAGRSADQAVMVGDSWEVDIEGARRAGIRPVWFNRYGVESSGSADVVEIKSLLPTDAVAGVILGS